MATYELQGGTIIPSAILGGGTIFPGGGGGGGGNLQPSKSVSYTPSETAISANVTPDYGYDAMEKVVVSVDAISSTYVGSGVARNDSTDLTASGATVTAPAGYYENAALKSIPNASAPEISGFAIDFYGDVEVSFGIDTGGYIASGDHDATLQQAVNVKPATTYYPSSSDQTIASNQWLYGAQTIKGVTTNNLLASNIKKDVVVEVGDSADPDRIASVTGTYEGGAPPTPDPYHIKVDTDNQHIIAFGNVAWNSNRASVSTDAGNRRSIWAMNGDTTVYWSTSAARTNLHLIPIPNDATTLSVTLDKSCQISVREWSGSGSSLSGYVAHDWTNITADTPLAITLTNGSTYIGIGLRVNSSSSNYTTATEPTTASLDFS